MTTGGRFYAGFGTKVHLGVGRYDDVVVLACGMQGRAFGRGDHWLRPTNREVSCRVCLRTSHADAAGRGPK